MSLALSSRGPAVFPKALTNMTSLAPLSHDSVEPLWAGVMSFTSRHLKHQRAVQLIPATPCELPGYGVSTAHSLGPLVTWVFMGRSYI